jgi:hypothetical protein
MENINIPATIGINSQFEYLSVLYIKISLKQSIIVIEKTTFYRGYFLMENSRTVKFAADMTVAQVLSPDFNSESLWKSLYSHSYTLFFNCEHCNFLFDIDGWFYTFDSIECPQCKTSYSGVFGKIITSTRQSHEFSQKSVLRLESFDNQSFDIQLPVNSNVFESKMDHIILVIFSKSIGKSFKPFCWSDWSIKNSNIQYFQPHSDTIPIKRVKNTEKKIKPIIPLVLLGLFSIIGLCSLIMVFTPGLQLFK